jgi:hypothetical protein
MSVFVDSSFSEEMAYVMMPTTFQNVTGMEVIAVAVV